MAQLREGARRQQAGLRATFEVRLVAAEDARAQLQARAERAEPIVARIAAEGHELANHLMRDGPSVQLSGPELQRQLEQVASLSASYSDIRWRCSNSSTVSSALL